MEQPEVCIISGRQRLVFSLALTMPRCSLRWLGMAPTGQFRAPSCRVPWSSTRASFAHMSAEHYLSFAALLANKRR
jgi:hypothetical protein